MRLYSIVPDYKDYIGLHSFMPYYKDLFPRSHAASLGAP